MTRATVAHILIVVGLMGIFTLLVASPILFGPRPIVHKYNLWLANGEKSEFRGERIESNGWCSLIHLNGRVDTIVCQAHLITEALEPEVPGPEGTPPARTERSADAVSQGGVDGS